MTNSWVLLCVLWFMCTCVPLCSKFMFAASFLTPTCARTVVPPPSLLLLAGCSRWAAILRNVHAHSPAAQPLTMALTHADVVAVSGSALSKLSTLEHGQVERLRAAIRTGAETHGKTVAAVLHGSTSAQARAKKQVSVALAHANFTAFDWIDRDQQDLLWVSLVQHKQVICRLCRGTSRRCAIMELKKSTLENHAARRHSASGAGAGGKVQRNGTVSQFSVVPMLTAAESIRAVHEALSAKLVSLGIPVSRLDDIYDPNVVALIKALPTFPGSRHAATSLVPAAVRTIETSIAAQVEGEYVALGVDATSTTMADGRTVMIVTASGPGLDEELLLHVEPMTHAENSDDIKAVVDVVRKKYPGMHACCLVGDNTNVNPAAAAKLGLPYANCAPHSLQLMVEAFVEQFPAVSKFLRDARAYVKAGGGARRKQELVTWGLSLSRLDFVETRWASLVRAVCYLLGPIEDWHARKADRALLALATRGGGGAAAPEAEAAAGVGERSDSVFTALYDVIDDDKDSETKEKATALLEYMTSMNNYAELCVIKHCLGSLDELFSILQGGPQYGGATEAAPVPVDFGKKIKIAVHASFTQPAAPRR